jgi:hypothetical protein
MRNTGLRDIIVFILFYSKVELSVKTITEEASKLLKNEVKIENVQSALSRSANNVTTAFKYKSIFFKRIDGNRLDHYTLINKKCPFVKKIVDEYNEKMKNQIIIPDTYNLYCNIDAKEIASAISILSSLMLDKIK